MGGEYHDHAWYAEKSGWTLFGSEFFGTGVLAYSICLMLRGGSVHLMIPLAVGGLLLSICNICGDLSGAHLNPCITLGIYAVSPRLSFRRVLIYLGAECSGAIFGFVLASWNFGSGEFALATNPFSLAAHQSSTVLQIVVAECVFTCLVVLTCLRCAILRVQACSMTPLWVAGAVVVASYASGGVSGACLNPALAIGFAFSSQSTWLADLIVYSIGPTMGAVAAAVICIALEPSLWIRRTGFITAVSTRQVVIPKKYASPDHALRLKDHSNIVDLETGGASHDVVVLS